MIRLFALLFLAVATLCPPAWAQDPLSYGTISLTDLTEPFHTRSKWSLVITQEPAAADSDLGDGDLHFCFLHNDQPSCPDILIHDCDYVDGRPSCATGAEADRGTPYNQFRGVTVFTPKTMGSGPLLVITAGGNWFGPGYPMGPIVYAYRSKADSFEQIFAATRSSSINTEARFITGGPLAGDIVLVGVTDGPPYAYSITVYRLAASQRYVKVLSYLTRTTYGDGNPLAVIDSEMPEIGRRLGFWKPGDPLPVPARMPEGYTKLTLRKGVEWCE